MEVLLASLIALALSAGAMSAFVAGNANVGVAATVFCGVFVQALPFLVLGVVVSGLIAAFVSRRAAGALAAPSASGGRRGRGCRRRGAAGLRVRFGAGGAATVRDGVAGAAALTFMLSAPAINPVVLVATAVAFPASLRWWPPAAWPHWSPPSRWGCCGCGGAAPNG